MSKELEKRSEEFVTMSLDFPQDIPTIIKLSGLSEAVIQKALDEGLMYFGDRDFIRPEVFQKAISDFLGT